MKKIKIYAILLILIMGFNSCNDYLNVLPENDQVADEFWQNKEEVESVIGAIYVKYRATIREQFVYGELRGNTIEFGNIIYGDEYDIWRRNVTPANSLCKWGKWYSIINLANMVITYAPEVMQRDPSFNQDLMKTYVAEAHYLRGLAYFFLVRNFRDVPLILKPYLNDSQEYEIPKSPESEVWELIIEDLLIAEEGTKSFYSDQEAWMSKGRATKWTVKATLADVYLWTEQYDKSIISCNDVINSGRVGLIAGYIPETETNNWYTLFSPGNSNESIFELQWDNNLGQSNGTLFGWFGNDPYKYIISQNTLELFENSLNDVRGLNATYQMPDLKIWKYIGSTAGSRFVETTGGYGVTRVDDEKDQNWIMYRLSDVVLMKAEALVMKGEYTTATDLVNQIRKRAQVTVLADPLTSELDMLDLVLNEKSLEFVAEGKRWYDLLRVAKRNNYQYSDYMIGEVLKNASPNSALIIQAALKNPDSHYLPIHFDELLNNKALVQNPYYEKFN